MDICADYSFVKRVIKCITYEKLQPGQKLGNTITHRVCENAVHRGSGWVRGNRAIRSVDIRDDGGDGGGSEESEFRSSNKFLDFLDKKPQDISKFLLPIVQCFMFFRDTCYISISLRHRA